VPCNAATFERQARALVALGPRAIAELLAELERAGAPQLRERVARYERLNPQLLRAFGGDRFPPRFAAVDGGKR
jgi:hypothetical protein